MSFQNAWLQQKMTLPLIQYITLSLMSIVTVSLSLGSVDHVWSQRVQVWLFWVFCILYQISCLMSCMSYSDLEGQKTMLGTVPAIFSVHQAQWSAWIPNVNPMFLCCFIVLKLITNRAVKVWPNMTCYKFGLYNPARSPGVFKHRKTESTASSRWKLWSLLSDRISIK